MNLYCHYKSVKVAGAANASFFPDNMLGNTELNVDTTNNHPALMSYFTNPFLLEIPDFLETLTMFP